MSFFLKKKQSNKIETACILFGRLATFANAFEWRPVIAALRSHAPSSPLSMVVDDARLSIDSLNAIEQALGAQRKTVAASATATAASATAATAAAATDCSPTIVTTTTTTTSSPSTDIIDDVSALLANLQIK
jgi:hypothetical protein